MKTTLLKITMVSALVLAVSCGGKETKKKTEAAPAATSSLEIEKPQLTFGFIKLTDMAPLAIAKEKGFFDKMKEFFN